MHIKSQYIILYLINLTQPSVSEATPQSAGKY